MSEESPRDRLMTGQSWETFCDALKSAGQTILGEDAPDDELNRAEGFRYLARLTRAGLESFLEYADPEAPELHRPIHETAKIGADNPDNYYQNAQISGAYEYRIVGRRNTIHYLDFATQTSGVASSGDSRQSGHVDAADLEIADDGSFEIVISCDERPGNWLRMVPETTQLIVRQTYLDRTSETPADLLIERIGGAKRPAPLTPELVDKGLTAAGGLVVGCSNLFSGWAKGFQAHVNELPKFDDSVSMGAGGDPNICYYHSYWQLGPEEALVIEVTPPECRSWNFQLDNHWMESLDYRYFRVTINKHTAVYEPDGSLKIVVAHEEPGHANWIETAGHLRGTMCFRWIRADAHPQPRCRVTKLAGLPLSGFRLPPNRAPVRALNAVFRAVQRLGIAKPALTAESLVRSARRHSGLTELGADFEDPVTQDALRRLLESLESEARLHPFGGMVLRGTLVNLLVTRMRLEQLSKEHPEIPALPVEAPVFIAGLARTGTTLLHRLLGCEPRLRPLLSWEGLTPAPLPGRARAPGRPDPRVARAVTTERALRYLAPDFFAIHPVESDGYEEDVLLQDGSFMSPTVDSTLPVPTYSAWLHDTDQTPMYRYFRRLVQLLLWQRPGTYLGKTPHHLENLPTLLEVFPDARVVVTHRDPAKVVPSFCSMMAHARRLFSDDVDLEDIGRQLHAKQVRGVTDAMNARASLSADAFLDVHYAELMADPMKEVRRIYDFLGAELLPGTVERMEAFRRTNPKDKRGVHRYGADEFGLTREQLDADFAAYREHYGIEREA